MKIVHAAILVFCRQRSEREFVFISYSYDFFFFYLNQALVSDSVASGVMLLFIAHELIGAGLFALAGAAYDGVSAWP